MAEPIQHERQPGPLGPVAVDAMGGDRGVRNNVAGALAAIREDGARVVLVGDEGAVREAITQEKGMPLLEQGLLRIHHAAEVVDMDEKPAQAARRKKQSSMRIACDLVKAGEACGALSAGNSGAMMAVGLLVFGRVRGVLRPAIATPIPSLGGPTIIVDAGANTDCEAKHLVQFGMLGNIFAQNAFGIDRPRIAVLANGEEESKGTALTRDVLAGLRATDMNVVGYCEGNDLVSGEVDVVVTDGFTGNVALKAAEGTSRYLLRLIKQGFAEGHMGTKLGGLLSKSMFDRMKARIDPRETAAAPLMGLRAPAFIAHGSSDAYAMRRAIGTVAQHASRDVTALIEAAISTVV